MSLQQGDERTVRGMTLQSCVLSEGWAATVGYRGRDRFVAIWRDGKRCVLADSIWCVQLQGQHADAAIATLEKVLACDNPKALSAGAVLADLRTRKLWCAGRPVIEKFLSGHPRLVAWHRQFMRVPPKRRPAVIAALRELLTQIGIPHQTEGEAPPPFDGDSNGPLDKTN